MWSNPESFKVILQIITILIAGVGISIAIYQLRLLRVTYCDFHDWNRRKAALEAVNKVFTAVAGDTPLLQDKFQILSSSDEIPLDRVRHECETDPKVRAALHRRLNFLEGLAIGIDQKVLDEMVVQKAFEPVCIKTVCQFKKYIEHRRNTGSQDAWKDLDDLCVKWQEAKTKSPKRLPTGVGI